MGRFISPPVAGLLNSPIVKGLVLPKADAFAQKVLDKVQTMPPEFWVYVEDTLLDLIEGKPEGEAKLRQLLGMMS